MVTVDQLYAALVYMWSELDKTIVGMGLTAYTVATLKGERTQREALLCGVFAMIAGTAMVLVGLALGIPSDGVLGFAAQGGSSAVAGAIGWYGTVRTAKFVENKFNEKGDPHDSDKG